MMTIKKEYKDFLNKKKIALVGPASSIEKDKNGEFIDSHDIVVRLNYAKIKNPDHSGTKTDVIYYDGSLHDYENLNLDFLICSYPITEWFFQERCKLTVEYFKLKYNHKIVDSVMYNNLKLSLNDNNKVRPNTGLIAMVDLLKYDVKSLFVTGIDFYRTGYLSSHPDYGSHSLNEIKQVFKQGDNGDYHDIDLQFEYFKNNIVKDERVKMDSFLIHEINKGG